MVSLPDAIKLAFSQYSEFGGRATRAEFWWYWLFKILGLVALAIVGGTFDLLFSTDGVLAGLAILGFLLGTFIPTLSVTSRRLHDINQSGWVQVILYIPYVNIIGVVVIIVLCCLDSARGSNRYGPDPRGELQVDGSYRSKASYFDETWLSIPSAAKNNMVVEKSADDSGSDEKQCRICNVSNKPNSTFCKQCGKHLGDAT